jgi:hypothetical protein
MGCSYLGLHLKWEGYHKVTNTAIDHCNTNFGHLLMDIVILAFLRINKCYNQGFKDSNYNDFILVA